MWVGVVVGCICLPFVGGGSSHWWAFVIHPWGVVIVHGRGGCCPQALFVVGAGSLFVGTGSPIVHGRQSAVVIVGAGSSCMLGRCLRILGCGLWAVGLVCGIRRSWMAGGCSWTGLFVGGGVMCSWLAKSDGTSGGGVLTVVHNVNNDERQHCHHSSFGCHVTLSDVAPGNPLMLIVVLVVVVGHVGGWKQVAAIDDGIDEMMVMVTEGSGFGGCFRFRFGGHGGVGVGVVDEVVVGRSKLIDVATNKKHMCSACGRCRVTWAYRLLVFVVN